MGFSEERIVAEVQSVQVAAKYGPDPHKVSIYRIASDGRRLFRKATIVRTRRDALALAAQLAHDVEIMPSPHHRSAFV